MGYVLLREFSSLLRLCEQAESKPTLAMAVHDRETPLVPAPIVDGRYLMDTDYEVSKEFNFAAVNISVAAFRKPWSAP